MRVDVFFDPYQPAQALFARMLVNLEGLNDDDATFHFALDHVDFGLATFSERFDSVKHGSPVHARFQCNRRARLVCEREPVGRLRS